MQLRRSDVSFLEPLILAALPLMALPVIIHLIHRHRHRSVPWGAMMFLVSAQRMSKGMARLRHILILLMRVLAIAALVFAVSRPLASGWLSGIGLGKPDATLVLLDRSASMETRDLQTGASKRSTALAKLAGVLEKRGFGTHLVLVDSATGRAQAIDSPEALLDLPQTQGTATSADIPSLLETALKYLEANHSGRADIWVCSDLSENDWDPTSGRWAALRERFGEWEGVHHFLLSYAARPAGNLAVRVENVRRRQNAGSGGGEAELVLDVVVRRTGKTENVVDSVATGGRVPIEFAVGGVRSVVELDLDRGRRLAERVSHSHRREVRVGLGRRRAFREMRMRSTTSSTLCSLSRPSDELSSFRTIRNRARPFGVRLPFQPTPDLKHVTEMISPARVMEIDWERTGVLCWQAPLPTGERAEQLRRFVDSGRVICFFPPVQKSRSIPSETTSLFASRWGDWRTVPDESNRVSWWRGDSDLLARTESGDALPLNDLKTYRYRTLETNATPLARLGAGAPLLARALTDRGAAYFCSTLPTARYSSLARDGVTFYAMLQRALAEGCRTLDAATQRTSSRDVLLGETGWDPVAPAGHASILSERGLHAGVFRTNGKRSDERRVCDPFRRTTGPPSPGLR